jgi:hypothetical protein
MTQMTFPTAATVSSVKQVQEPKTTPDHGCKQLWIEFGGCMRGFSSRNPDPSMSFGGPIFEILYHAE